VRRGDIVDQFLGLLPGQEFVGVVPHQFRQVRGDDRGVVDNGEAFRYVGIAVLFGDPVRIEVEDRLLRGNAVRRPFLSLGTHGKEVPRDEAAAAHLYALQQDNIFRRAELQVVPELHGRDHDAQFDGYLLADGPDLVEKLAILLGVYDRYEAVADLDLTNSLVQAAKSLGINYRVGITASSDTFYPGQERYDSFTGYVPRRFQGSLEEWQKLNVLNYEMESATLLTVANVFGLQAAMVAAAIVSRVKQEEPDPVAHAAAEKNLSRIIKEALTIHIQENQA